MLLQSVLALEALDAPCGVDQTLLTGVKRMTVRADLDVQLFGRRASLKGVAARAGYYAAAVFGMNLGFHLGESNHSFRFRQRYHHPSHQTIPWLSRATFRGASVACAALLILAATGIACAETPATQPVPAPGFSAQGENIFNTVLALAPPGPSCAQRSLAIADRQLDFQGKIWLHPEFSPPVRKLLDKLPPRQATLIRATSLYSRKDIAWTELPEKARQVSVIGRPEQESYLYELATKYQTPQLPFHMAGAFTLRPVPGSVDGDIRAVDGQVGGDLLTDTYGASGGLAFLAALLRFIHGDLRPPWDTQPGVFNHHDHAILDRFHTDFPNFSAKVEHYLKFRNVLDEFSGSGDPVVLFNLDAELQTNSLKPFPQLYEFYRSIGPSVVAKTVVTDSHGNRWLETQFDRGRMRIIFMVRRGLLTPFNDAYQPVAGSVDLTQSGRGTYHTRTSATITRLGLTFGLEGVSFATNFRSGPDTVETTSTMEAVPTLVAPPGVHKIIDLIAGEFLRVLAQGDGGFRATFSSHPEGSGLYRWTGSANAEFSYAPALELLARVGDSVADAHSAEVKREERQLGQELFDAFVTDYNDSRPKLLALDDVREDSRENAPLHH
jgi:hypothetical protein